MSITFIIVSIRDKHSCISEVTMGRLGFLTFILRFMKLIESQDAVITELILPHFFILWVAQGFFLLFILLSSKQQGSFSKVGVNAIMSFGSSSQLLFRITAQNVDFFSLRISGPFWSFMRNSLNMYFNTKDHHDLQVSSILLGCAC